MGVLRDVNNPRKSVLRERFEAVKDAALDDAMGKGESWAKKVGYGNQGVMLDDIPKLLDTLGFKLVDKSKVCVEKATHEAYKALAAAHLRGEVPEPDGPKLDWGESKP
jgi:hypothetical protein